MTREHCIETSNEAAAVAWNIAESLVDDGAPAPGSTTQALCAALNGVRCAILATLAEPAPPAIAAGPSKMWVSVELLGHRQHIGLAEEGEWGGKRGFWLQVLERERGAAPRIGEKDPPLLLPDERIFYSNAALFSIVPLDGADAAVAMWRSRHGYGDDIPF